MKIKFALLFVLAGVLLLSGCARFGVPDDPPPEVDPLNVSITSVDVEYPYATVVGCITGGERPYMVAYDCDTAKICPPGQVGPCVEEIPCPPCPPEETECCFELVCDYTCKEGTYTLTITVLDAAGDVVAKQLEIGVEKPDDPVVTTYKVEFVDHDGSILKTQTVEHGEDAVPPADPEREGYEFTGWKPSYVNVTEDLVVVAQYDPVEDDDVPPPPPTDWHVITATAGEDGTISPSGNVSVLDGTDRKFTITPDEGYEIADVLVDGDSVFDDLVFDNGTATYTFTSVSGDHEIHAEFTVIVMYTLQWDVTRSRGNPRGGVKVNGASAAASGNEEFPAGTEVVLEAIPNAERTFSRWKGAPIDDMTENPVTITMDDDYNIKAVFVE